jgi:hypothetical protein
MPEAAPTAAPATTVSPPVPSPSPQPAPAVAAKPVTPGSKAWAEMTTEQRHAQLRGPENPRILPGYEKMSFAQRRLAQDQARGEAPPPPADRQPAPADGGKFKVGKFEVSEGEIAAMMDRQAQDDLRKATAPASPEAYEARLPADLKLPAGQEYTFDASDPSLAAARNWAHAKGLSQDDFSQVLGIYASHVAGQEAILAERSRAEIAKAGVNAPQRMDAVTRWITAEVGEADARPIRATIVTDAHLRFYEKLMNKISSQGGASFSQSHRAPPESDGKIPGYAEKSFEQRRLAQDQIAARRRG